MESKPTRSRAYKKMNTKKIGNIGEAKTLAKFVELGIPVYIPFGDNESADLIVEFNGKLNKIQCKTTDKVKDGIIIWNIKSVVVTGGTKWKTHKYTEDEVDYFSLYCKELDLLLLVPIQAISARTALSFTYPYREVKSAHSQRNFEDFLFEKIIWRVM